MDFILRLPRTKFQHDYIFVVFDRLTKVSHFIPHNTKDDILVISWKCIKDIFRLHGFPENTSKKLFIRNLELK